MKKINFMLVGPNGRDKMVAPIYESTDYGQFKIMFANRVLDKSNLKRLEASFKDYPGLVRPIWVNDSMEVIDGQHRLQVAITLKIPLFFYISPGTISAARVCNTYTGNWKTINYHESLRAEGHPAHVILGKLYKDYESLPVKVIDIVATGLARGEKQINPDPSGHRLSSRSKITGEGFEIKPEEEVRELLSKLWDYHSAVRITRKFARVLTEELFNNPTFDHDYFVQKVKAAQISPTSYTGIVLKNPRSGLIEFPDTTKDIKDAIGSLYNKAKTKKVKLF